MNVIGLVLTLVLGFFIIIGAFLMHIFENKERFLVISLSMAFGVMASLIFLELLPESFEIFNEKYSSIISIAMILIFSIIGFLILKILDKLIHVGIVSSIAIILHNIIEGMAIYNTFNTSINLGILLSIGVGLHNIPLGMVLSSTFYKSLSNKKKSNVIIFLISTSTFVGGLIMCIFNNVFKNEFIIGLLLSITVGMLVYINIIEILPKLIKSKDKKMIITSIIVGILILFVSVFLE